VFNIQHKDRKIIPTGKLPFTKVVNKAKPVFDSEWDEKNKALIKACVEERRQETLKTTMSNKNALKLVKDKQETLREQAIKKAEDAAAARK
jgi:hypothetical protein